MPPPKDSPYQLWVEGADDKYTLIQLLVRHGYDWDAAAAQRPHIRVAGSVEQLLRSVPTAVKTSHTRRLGWVLDANGDAAGQWQRLRDRLLSAEVEAPAELPEGRAQAPLARQFVAWFHELFLEA